MYLEIPLTQNQLSASKTMLNRFFGVRRLIIRACCFDGFERFVVEQIALAVSSEHPNSKYKKDQYQTGLFIL